MEDIDAPFHKGYISALKGDIPQPEFRKEQGFERPVTRIEERFDFHGIEMGHRYQDLAERSADGQTDLLKAFCGYGEGINKREAGLEDNEALTRSRTATFGDRVLVLERRLKMLPFA